MPAIQVPAIQASAAREIPGHPGLATELEALGRPLIDGGLVPGYVLGIQLGDQAWIQGYGSLTPGGEMAPDAHTLFEIGSISKVFTGILLADAVERGVLELDDPVNERLDLAGDAPFHLPTFGEQPIRFWHLSTHSSGLPRLPTNFNPKDPDNPYADYTLEDLKSFLETYELPRAPGKTFAYSNLGAGLLGNVLAIGENTTYPELLAERITGPLGLESTRCRIDGELAGRVAPGYDSDGEPHASWDLPLFQGAGGVRSDMTDMLRFARANLHPEETPLEEALKLAQEVHFRDPKGPTLGLGWFVGGGGSTRFHTGQTGGYHSYLALVPGKDLAVVLLANSSCGKVETLAENALRLLLGLQPLPIDVRPSIELPPEDLEPLVGEYRLGLFKKMTVTLERGRLFAQITRQPKLRLHAAEKDLFFYRAVEAEVRFLRDDTGAVTGLEIHQNGAVTSGRRL